MRGQYRSMGNCLRAMVGLYARHGRLARRPMWVSAYLPSCRALVKWVLTNIVGRPVCQCALTSMLVSTHFGMLGRRAKLVSIHFGGEGRLAGGLLYFRHPAILTPCSRRPGPRAQTQAATLSIFFIFFCNMLYELYRELVEAQGEKSLLINQWLTSCTETKAKRHHFSLYTPTQNNLPIQGLTLPNPG